MTKLKELAKYLRSKNAGAFKITIDIIFDDNLTYTKVKSSEKINKKLIQEKYNVSQDKISIIEYDVGNAIKINLDRPVSSGDIGDTDVYGAQQHVPLLNVDI